MSKEQLKKLTDRIIYLEQKCQDGKDVPESMAEIEQIANQLSVIDLLELATSLEESI